MKIKWFCRDCWRSGESDTFEYDALKVAKKAHADDVRLSVEAQKIPAGMDPRARNAKQMDKYPGVDCKGDVLLGERKGRPRIPKP